MREGMTRDGSQRHRKKNMGLKPASWPSIWLRYIHVTLTEAGKRKFDLQPFLTKYLD
jgi:hypothetical protein